MSLSRRDFTKAAALLLSGTVLPGILLTGAGQPPPPRRIQFTAEQEADLDRISAYLNSIRSLQAGFVQVGADGNMSQGLFYLAKPGRLRFEYRPPSPNLIVAAGGNIYVKNSRLNTVDRYSLSDTPLGLLLDEDINLRRNPAVLGVTRENGALVLRARTSTNRTQDNIAIVFTAPTLELRQWTVKDNQGGLTSVALTQVQTGVTIPEAAFAIPVKAPSIKKGGH